MVKTQTFGFSAKCQQNLLPVAVSLDFLIPHNQNVLIIDLAKTDNQRLFGVFWFKVKKFRKLFT